MKHIILTLTLLSCLLNAEAQTMYIWQKGVGTAVNESLAGDIIFSADGAAFTVLGKTFNTQTTDSVTFDAETVDPLTVSVNYNETTATAILPIGLSDSVNVEIDGAYVNVVSQSLGGDEITYSLTGTSANGAFTQDGTYKCTLVLDGINLTSQRGAAIDIQNGKRIDVNVVEGTTNTLSDYAQGLQKACFYVKGHPEFFGKGTLNITGNANHAFSTKEYTRLKSSAGTINILSAKNDGMHVGQYLKVEGGNINVRNVAGDGLQAEATKDSLDEANGQAIIMGGTIDIEVNSNDVKALRSDSLMTISGGTINIVVTGDGSKGIASDTDLIINQDNAPVNIKVNSTGGEYVDPANPVDTKKSHGISVKGNLTVTAGTLDISATGKKGKSIKVDGVSKKSTAASIKTNPVFYFDSLI